MTMLLPVLTAYEKEHISERQPLPDRYLSLADEEMDARIEDFPAYRQDDVRFHIGLAQSTGSARLVASATEVQGAMTDLISYIAHPPEVLEWSNAQHAQLLQAVTAGDTGRAVSTMVDHLAGTEHVLAGLLPPG